MILEVSVIAAEAFTEQGHERVSGLSTTAKSLFLLELEVLYIFVGFSSQGFHKHRPSHSGHPKIAFLFADMWGGHTKSAERGQRGGGCSWGTCFFMQRFGTASLQPRIIKTINQFPLQIVSSCSKRPFIIIQRRSFKPNWLELLQFGPKPNTLPVSSYHLSYYLIYLLCT